MKKTKRLQIRINPELIEIIEEKGDGINFSDKVRNLLISGLKLKEVNTYIENK